MYLRASHELYRALPRDPPRSTHTRVARYSNCLSRVPFFSSALTDSTFLRSVKLRRSRRRSWETARLRTSFSPCVRSFASRQILERARVARPSLGPSRLFVPPSFFFFYFTLFYLISPVETDKANRPMRRVTGEIPGTFLIAVDLNYDVRFESGLPLPPPGRLFPILPL